ncbi:Rossmann-like and DUF2520 domain-containing protein [Veillonella criceti]|uniref:Uncharacterized conserved protein n=1 Tax=Veillonella criceti TaxID=103891 RepID=A0A380NNB1_9FIRM|nr:Rossmann-like and DUF2520 domain-containing protein [Veillonella criceti]SUP44016.1 Uncharacterized conserved protein [Veillonella criceti]
MKIGIIGGGKVGQSLASALANDIVGIIGSSPKTTTQLAQQFQTPPYTQVELLQQSDVIFLTVPDRLIGAVATAVTSNLTALNQPSLTLTGKTFLHCSGSLGLEPLEPLTKLGAATGSLHPLQTFAHTHTPLSGVYMAIDGDSTALSIAQSIVTRLGGQAFHVPPEERAIYHAAACICSNYTVTLQALAQQLISHWLPSNAAWQALLPLFQGTVQNVSHTTEPRTVLTGPIARGDVATIKQHLATLPSEYLPSYCSLGRLTTQLALQNGTISMAQAKELRELLTKE